MRMSLIAALAAILVFSLNAAEVAGVWKGSVETQMGTMGITLTFQAGSGVAGDLKSDMVEGKIANGKLDGDKVSFQVESSYGMLGFEGTVAGDEMKLTMTGTSGNKYPLICKRQK